MGGRRWTVVDLDRGAVAAVGVRVSGGAVRLGQWKRATAPKDLEWSNAGAVGAWLGSALRDSGLGGPFMLAVPRGDVVMKEIDLPAEGLELGEMIASARLQLKRQAAVDVDEQTIDLIDVGGDDGGRRVLAGALPSDRSRWLHDVADAAGLKLGRIRLRSSGSGAMLAGMGGGRWGVLGVSLGPRSAEFVLAEQGKLAFVRTVQAARPEAHRRQEPGDRGDAADTPTPEEVYAARIAVEARRTLLSLRSGQEEREIASVALLADDELARRAGEAIERELDLPVELLGVGDRVEGLDRVPAADRCAFVPLVGLALAELDGIDVLDFGRPRQPPDRRARARQVALAVLLALAAIVGIAYTFGKVRTRSLDREIAEARDQRARVTGQYVDMLVDDLRAAHAERWVEGGVDWLAHLDAVVARLPEPGEVVLGELSGVVAADIGFERSVSGGVGGDWRTERQASITVQGTVRGREIAAGTRERLLRGGGYRVVNKGPDVDDRLALELLTPDRRPPVEASE